MCKCKCKCKSNDEQKMICIEEHKYLFAKEMYQHYKELFEVAVNELKFKSMNVQHLLSVLEECVVLLGNKRPHMVIATVIENWIDRHNIDVNIHNSMIWDWQPSFADIVCDEVLENDDIDKTEEWLVNADFDDGDIDEWYKELLSNIKDLVNEYIEAKNAQN